MLQAIMRNTRSWLDRHPALAVFLIAVLTTAAVSPGIVGSDTFRRLQVTHWLWTSAPQVAPDDHEPSMNLPGRNGAVYPPYGIGQSIIMLPGDMIASTATAGVRHPLIKERARVAILWYLTFPAITGLAVLFGYLLVRELGYGAEVATLASLATLFGSSVLQYAHNAQENNLLLLLLLGSCHLALRWVKTNKPAFAAGTAALLGYGLLVRPTTLAAALAVVVLMVLALRAAPVGDPLRRLRGLFIGLAVFLLFAGLERLYHWYRFGDVFGTYIKVQAAHFAQTGGYAPGHPFGHPFWPGFLGPFLDLEKSVFVFDPLLLLPLAVWILPIWRNDQAARRVVASALVLLVVTCALYATSYWWPGDSAWGPRHHVLPVQLAVLAGTAAVIARWPVLGWPARRGLIALFCLAAATQLASVVLDYNLEVAQRIASDTPLYVPGLRVVNIAAIITDNFSAWGLQFGDPAILRQAASGIWLFPIRSAGYLPWGPAMLLVGLWMALVGLLGWLVWDRIVNCVERLRTGP